MEEAAYQGERVVEAVYQGVTCSGGGSVPRSEV